MLNVPGYAGSAEKLSVGRGEDANLTMEWLTAKLSFEVLRSYQLSPASV